MAGRALQRPAVVPALSVAAAGDPATQRALDQIADAVQRLQAQRSRAVIEDIDLAVGTNVIRHGLGRPVLGYTLVATVANAGFAHALDVTNPRPDLELWITIIGVAQSGARIEVW